ncbi:hypothetical protein, partial [Bradyrhizobium diazoefficiens]|uniref:hypothetical protein n=1 Tax=Bradyrhizobium diazoefficiens TaxID=1355477 RepID=UPI001B8D32B0
MIEVVDHLVAVGQRQSDASIPCRKRCEPVRIAPESPYMMIGQAIGSPLFCSISLASSIQV